MMESIPPMAQTTRISYREIFRGMFISQVRISSDTFTSMGITARNRNPPPIWPKYRNIP